MNLEIVIVEYKKKIVTQTFNNYQLVKKRILDLKLTCLLLVATQTVITVNHLKYLY